MQLCWRPAAARWLATVLLILHACIKPFHVLCSIPNFSIDILQTLYDKQYPTQFHNNPVMPHHHEKRCVAVDTAQTVDHFLKGTWREATKVDNAILVSSPCLGSDSLGNNLGSYFENIACAHHMKMHYAVVAKVYEPKQQDKPTSFLAALPSIIEHPSPANSSTIRANIKATCRCPGSCHERTTSMWIKEIPLVKSIFTAALQSHLHQSSIKATVVGIDDLSNVPQGTTLPLIPDAAVHYRCGDNFVGHYGFLPFSALKQNIPAASKTIYIMAENRNRKTTAKRQLAAKCDAVFVALFDYLKSNFPKSKILIQRGGDMYVDMARLSFAPVVVCSVSTFCLWPALANPNNGTVYFPRTKLIVGGDTSINLGFKWLLSPAVVLGQNSLGSSPAQLIARLNDEKKSIL